MNSALANKFTRLVLAISVSVWMAGGCLFGCGNIQVMTAEIAPSIETAVSGESCDAARSHDCCAKPAKTVTRARTRSTSHGAATEALAAVPHGMKDCPLMMSATAITAKSSGNLPDPGRAPVALLPGLESTSEQTQVTIGSSYLPNRGPTHLRCCVFLI